MDYVRGEPLDTHVRLSQPAIRSLIEMFRLIVDAVAYAHRRGVVHRDLKPSNILVNTEGSPCVLDFGLAKIISDDLQDEQQQLVSVAGGLMGTLRYMSPEQTLGNSASIDVRTDVYTLGVILYELLTGFPPYETNIDLSKALQNIREADPPRPSRWRRECDSDLETILLAAMAKEPERRYQSASELSADLGAWLDGRPISAKSTSSLYVLKKLAFRHYFESLVVCAMLAFLLGGSIILFQQAREQKRNNAIVARDNTLLQSNVVRLQQALRGVADAAPRQQLGWFLLEWENGRLDRARKMHDTAPLPLKTAMAFLLDEAYSMDRFLSEVGPNEIELAYFVAGERSLKAGRAAQAGSFYQRVVDDQGPGGYLKEAARARLGQLGLTRFAESRPSAQPAPTQHREGNGS
jgi:hypothetical protein